ncbi:hypothetical protein PanWU01x14_090150 [Parasponia andersonii]|uniref:Uncharacterized protein n=1 Tax=Parasponia andersonii TaxID=3476 RepID=A0A2P5D7M0_PARAD|nr:hypothetical protein PanWU01x14_090150 [Parasponia andersonii]
MAKKMRCLDAWIEMAPALLILHNKTSNSPRFETIIEEEFDTEEYDNEAMSRLCVEITASDFFLYCICDLGYIKDV